MRRYIAVLLALILCLTAAGCGTSPPDEPLMTDGPVTETPTPEISAEPTPAMPLETESLAVDLHSSDTQYVIKMGDLYTIYALEGGAVVGMSTYCEYSTPELAMTIVRQSTPETDPTVLSCLYAGTKVLISYKEPSYLGLNRDLLDAVYSSVKVS